LQHDAQQASTAWDYNQTETTYVPIGHKLGAWNYNTCEGYTNVVTSNKLDGFFNASASQKDMSTKDLQ